MEEEKQLGAIEQKVPLENTRPVSDPDEILQLLNELLKRTEAMEERLDRIPPIGKGLYWLADEDDTVESPSRRESSAQTEAQ